MTAGATSTTPPADSARRGAVPVGLTRPLRYDRGMRIRWRAAPVLVMAAGVVGCSGDDPAPSTTLPVPTTVAVTDSVGSTVVSTTLATSAPIVSDPANETTVPASTPGSVATIPLTLPPVTTEPLPADLTDDERAVIEAVRESFELGQRCANSSRRIRLLWPLQRRRCPATFLRAFDRDHRGLSQFSVEQ